MLLHKMNRIDDARAFIEPIINKDPEKVNKLADIAVRRYLDGERNLAISITSQLVNLCPDVIRLKTNLGYMQIGERAYDQAESLLIDVIDTKIIDEDEEIFIVISKCNLLYLYILQNKFDKTFSLLEEIFASNKRDEEAILRVPFWFQGEIQPDPAQFPGRDITMEMAALGCGIAAALAQGDIEKADKLNDSLIDKEFEDPLPLICEGCVQASKGNQEEAVDAFTEAIKMSENEEEKSILQNWLEKLENNDSNNNS
jgi:tetratricopeptide (TPR) repeat protein